MGFLLSLKSMSLLIRLMTCRIKVPTSCSVGVGETSRISRALEPQVPPPVGPSTWEELVLTSREAPHRDSLFVAAQLRQRNFLGLANVALVKSSAPPLGRQDFQEQHPDQLPMR